MPVHDDVEIAAVGQCLYAARLVHQDEFFPFIQKGMYPGVDFPDLPEGLSQPRALSVVVSEDADEGAFQFSNIFRGKGRHNISGVQHQPHTPVVEQRHRLLYGRTMIVRIRDQPHQMGMFHPILLINDRLRLFGGLKKSHVGRGLSCGGRHPQKETAGIRVTPAVSLLPF